MAKVFHYVLLAAAVIGFIACLSSLIRLKGSLLGAFVCIFPIMAVFLLIFDEDRR